MVDFTLKNANILIVDDMEANIDILTGLLELQGYQNIMTTTDPRQVMSLFKSFNPDLILLDLMMPHLSGYEVMNQLKALIPRAIYMPILVLTADISAEAKQRALAEGAKDFLAKPFDLAEVSLRINNLLFARFLHQQLLKQNQNLDEKVRERTRELEMANIEITAARDRAEESDYLKTAFLNNISHEIRTPFNGLLGFLSLLQDENLPVSERDEYIGIINESSRRLMNTINYIVEISQIQAGQMKLAVTDTNVRSLANELYEYFRYAAEKKGLIFSVQNHLTNQSECLLTDRIKLKSILLHLIDNAIKFTKEGTVEFGIRKSSYYMEFYVKDTGTGIAEKMHKTIFERFMQVDVSNTRQFEGTGLGLAIAKAHSEMLGGSIWLESEMGKGTTFYVQIPTKASRNMEKQPVSDIRITIPEETEKTYILVAEDDDINYHYIHLILTKANYHVLRAHTGIEAIEYIRLNINIGLIIMDIKMPGLDGYSATGEIHSTKPGIPVVALTAYAFQDESHKAVQAGCNDFLAKPIKKEELLLTVGKYYKP